MRKLFAILSFVAIASAVGCNMSSPRGGGMSSADGFRVVVPHEIDLQQGAVQTINVTLDRGDLFKQDVKLAVTSTKGISVDPAGLTIKASDKPEALVKVSAAKDAPLGEYRVNVTGTPASGQSTTAEFRVKVVTN